MKAEELRIRNIVEYLEYSGAVEDGAITEIGIKGVWIDSLFFAFDCICPATINQWYLESFGFLFSNETWNKDGVIIEFAGNHCQLIGPKKQKIGEPFWEVHKLQNLFYALTNTELTLTPQTTKA